MKFGSFEPKFNSYIFFQTVKQSKQKNIVTVFFLGASNPQKPKGHG